MPFINSEERNGRTNGGSETEREEGPGEKRENVKVKGRWAWPGMREGSSRDIKDDHLRNLKKVLNFYSVSKPCQ